MVWLWTRVPKALTADCASGGSERRPVADSVESYRTDMRSG